MGTTGTDTQLLDRIFETSPTGIVVLTPEGEITRCNERAEQLLELSESDIEGRRYTEPEWSFFDADGAAIPDSEHPFVRVQESCGPIFGQEYQLKRPHADPIEVSVSGAPLTADGETKRLVFAFEDITDRRRRERELQIMTRQLEVLNRVVRHDIRNEMAVVLGSIETALEADADATAHLERAYQAGEHVVSITTAARDLMDVVTSTEPPELEPIDLEPVLAEEVTMIREGHPEATVQIEGSIPDLAVRATDLLDSVFRNILTNAIDHNDREEPTVTVSAERADDRVRVRIADDGPGVPEDQKWSIFGKGDRGLESAGTGIGLYLVESLVRQFGGDVWVEDNEPRGAVFVVELETAE